MRVLSRAFPSTSSHLSATTTAIVVDRRPPPNLGRWANFKRFLWNKEKRTVCNRTCTNWVLIISYYTLFICTVVGIFLLTMLIFTRYIRNNYKRPWIEKTTMGGGTTPGLGFIPNILRIDAPLIWYSQAEDGRGVRYSKYSEYIRNFINEYEKAERNREQYSDCDTKKEEGKPCLFATKNLGECGQDEFGYNVDKPCFYIKMNKMPRWQPEYYNVKDLPDEMPDDLKNAIKDSTNHSNMWIHCTGQRPVDKDHLGNLKYFPGPAIKGYYFPYTGERNYLSPVVAVQAAEIKSKGPHIRLVFNTGPTAGRFVQTYLSFCFVPTHCSFAQTFVQFKMASQRAINRCLLLACAIKKKSTKTA